MKDLTPEQYHICFECGTEAPFSGIYYDHWEEGTYHCVACDNALFSSETKYNSHSGWPSFWASISKDAIILETDFSHGMTRTEVSCKNCHAHLGHVFGDGPPPTHERYCINSLSLNFTKK